MKNIMVAHKDQIIKITEKAVLIDFVEINIWLPLSQIEIKKCGEIEGCIFTNFWMAKQKGILPSQQYRKCVIS